MHQSPHHRPVPQISTGSPRSRCLCGRRLPALLAGFVILLVLGPGCDGSHAPQPADISGRVLLACEPCPDAVVYVARQGDVVGARAPAVVDSTGVDARGRYRFSGLEAGTYRVYAGVWAGVWAGDAPGFAHVSPFSSAFDIGDLSHARLDLSLVTVAAAGGIDGAVLLDTGEGPEPAAGVDVALWRYEGRHQVEVGAAVTDAAGRYAWPAVSTGNYVVSATDEFPFEAPDPGLLTGETPARFCDGASNLTMPDIVLSETPVRKPAVYLYPEQPTTFAVELRLGSGVRLTASEPEYGSGWRVHVEPGGRIDGQWDYLFYELGLAGWPQVPTGWRLDGEDLSGGLERIVAALGLDRAETDDFLDYWLARLPRRPWYAVRPLVDDDLDGLARLDIRPAPDTRRRFWLFFEGSQTPPVLRAPVIAPFVRRGTVVVEWGGAVAP